MWRDAKVPTVNKFSYVNWKCFHSVKWSWFTMYTWHLILTIKKKSSHKPKCPSLLLYIDRYRVCWRTSVFLYLHNQGLWYLVYTFYIPGSFWNVIQIEIFCYAMMIQWCLVPKSGKGEEKKRKKKWIAHMYCSSTATLNCAVSLTDAYLVHFSLSLGGCYVLQPKSISKDGSRFRFMVTYRFSHVHINNITIYSMSILHFLKYSPTLHLCNFIEEKA